MTEELGDQMKAIEAVEAQRRLDPRLPIILRCDGCSFSKFTRGLDRPFDEKFLLCMRSAALAGMKHLSADIAYTQSDEITFVILPSAHPLFNARTQKLCSITASVVSVNFNLAARKELPEGYDRGVFDCRAWNTEKVEDVLRWREKEAIRNSVSMYARSMFSTKEMHGKKTKELIEMIRNTRKKPWEELSSEIRKGTRYHRIIEEKRFELKDLPPKHKAHQVPDLMVRRSKIVVVAED